MRKFIGIAVVTAAVSLVAAGCSSQAAPTEAETSRAPAPTSWLFTVSGQGKSESIGGKSYLTLSDPSDVLAFTSRPARAKIEMPTEAVVALWQGVGFQTDPPNSAVTGGGTSQAVVLQNPAMATDGAVRWLAPGLKGPLSGPTAVTIDGGVVNTQITDSVTQTNVMVLGEPPARAIANLYTVAAAALRNSVSSSTNDQLSSLTLDSSEIAAIQKLLTITGGQGVPGAGTPTRPA